MPNGQDLDRPADRKNRSLPHPHPSFPARVTFYLSQCPVISFFDGWRNGFAVPFCHREKVPCVAENKHAHYLIEASRAGKLTFRRLPVVNQLESN